MNKQLLNKYFRNQCTLKETEEVLAWFQTGEGQAYLEESLKQDMHHYADEERLMLYPDIASDPLLERIKRSRKSTLTVRRRTSWPMRTAVAAIILIIGVAQVGIYMYDKQDAASHLSEIVYHTIKTESDQNRLVTLSDGSKIRLNANSSIRVPEPLQPDNRTLTLKGEAWFDIEQDASRPFIITAGSTKIHVLGTQFNVKSDSLRQQVQVAVAEGKVSFSKENGDGQSAILTKNTFAVYDLKNDDILIEHTPVENYLSWFSGRLYFYNDPLRVVSRYLERIYDVDILFEIESLKELPLSIDLTREDLPGVLDIIGRTLNLTYHHEKDTVLWTNQKTTKTPNHNHDEKSYNQ